MALACGIVALLNNCDEGGDTGPLTVPSLPAVKCVSLSATTTHYLLTLKGQSSSSTATRAGGTGLLLEEEEERTSINGSLLPCPEAEREVNNMSLLLLLIISFLLFLSFYIIIFPLFATHAHIIHISFLLSSHLINIRIYISSPALSPSRSARTAHCIFCMLSAALPPHRHCAGIIIYLLHLLPAPLSFSRAYSIFALHISYNNILHWRTALFSPHIYPFPKTGKVEVSEINC